MLPSEATLEAQDAVRVSGNDLRMPFSDEGPVARYVVLASVPSSYRVLSEHHINHYLDRYESSDSEVKQLFYKDRTRTFFAAIETETTTEYLQASKAYPGLPRR